MTRSSLAANACVERRMAGAASAIPSAVRLVNFSVIGVSSTLYFTYLRSNPTAIHDIVLRRAHAAVVGGKEQHHARNIRRIEFFLQALPLGNLAFASLVQPQLHLPV